MNFGEMIPKVPPGQATLSKQLESGSLEVTSVATSCN